MDCPCQSGDRYDRCCGRFISHQHNAGNAQQLMRSRYTAFALKRQDYIIETWHVDYCPAGLQMDDAIKWVRLDILDQLEQEDSAMVEFEAGFLRNGRLDGLHERSEFVYQQGRWWYTCGKHLPLSHKPRKPGSNEGCPCGSGVKYKRCCGR